MPSGGWDFPPSKHGIYFWALKLTSTPASFLSDGKFSILTYRAKRDEYVWGSCERC